MSTTTQKILSLLSASEVDLKAVVDLIQYDPALTTNVLKLVNSAYFGLNHKVTSIRQAVVMLGINQVHRIVITVSFSPLMNRDIPGYDLTAGSLWEHSVATAVASETIANMLSLENTDSVFTAALLHDIGKIALASFVEQYFTTIDEVARDNNESFEIVEKQILGIDHAEAGSMVLKNWDIPQDLYLPVKWHHNTEDCDKTDLQVIVDTIHLADSLSLAGGFGLGRDGLQYRPSQNVVKRLNLKRVMLESIMSNMMTGIKNFKEIFAL